MSPTVSDDDAVLLALAGALLLAAALELAGAELAGAELELELELELHAATSSAALRPAAVRPALFSRLALFIREDTN
jgi:hypothetical protein